MSEPVPRRVRRDLPFRRIALALSGGGALGAYEVGVLRVLETAGIRPAVVAGVSVGAINAVLWLAHGCRTEALERVWAKLRPSSIGMRWSSLLVRAAGAGLMVLAAVQIVLTLAGSHELSPRRMFDPLAAARGGGAGALLDALAWLVIGVLGLLALRWSRTAEASLARLSPSRDPHRLQRWGGVLLALASVLHLVAWIADAAWPYRFSASVLLVWATVWFVNRPGEFGARLRRMLLRLLPETGGRGLWGSDARRRLIRSVVEEGDPALLVAPGVHLIISACSIGSGRTCYFTNWQDPSADFRERISESMGEVAPLGRADDIIEAAVASSAVPAVFEPVRIGGREFVDGGVFGSQPIHAVLADGADAVLVVLVSPTGGLSEPQPESNLVELAGRILEIANWRSLQTELRALPRGWSRAPSSTPGLPPVAARVCVVEPEGPLPGAFFGPSPGQSAELERRGTRDAWRALEAAGWLEESAGSDVSISAAPAPGA